MTDHPSVDERFRNLEKALVDTSAAMVDAVGKLEARVRELEDALRIAVDRVRILEHGEDIRDEREEMA